MRSFNDPDARPPRRWKAKTQAEQAEYEERCRRVIAERAERKRQEIADRAELVRRADAGDKGAQMCLALQMGAGNPTKTEADGFPKEE